MTSSEPGLSVSANPGHCRLYAWSDRHDTGVVVDRVIPPNRGVMSGEAYAQRKHAEYLA
jgi:hypothetical protein